MKEDTTKSFEPVDPTSDAPPHELRSAHKDDLSESARRPSRAPDVRPAWTHERREVIRSALLWITVAVLALAVFTFLVSVNNVISIWFRSQWAPVARSVAALAVIGLCLWVMMRLVNRDVAVPK